MPLYPGQPQSPLAPFWDGAEARRLMVQTCRACGDTRFPPAPVCPHCLSPDQEWRAASGEGTLESWAEFHRAYWDRDKDRVPYSVCLVRLKEGPLLISNLVGAESARPRHGARVHVVFEPGDDGKTVPKFALTNPEPRSDRQPGRAGAKGGQDL